MDVIDLAGAPALFSGIALMVSGLAILGYLYVMGPYMRPGTLRIDWVEFSKPISESQERAMLKWIRRS
jgi:hypothetical protein